MRAQLLRRALAGAVLVTVAAWLGIPRSDILDAQTPATVRPSARITIHAPHPEPLELALDEVELDWSGAPAVRGRAAAAAVEAAGARLSAVDERRAVFRPANAGDLRGLWAVAEALEAANPGAQARLVLYEPGLPRSEATRRLLTREVALLLGPAEEPQDVLVGLSVGPVRAVPGVRGGYVVEARDPIDALDLADLLRQRLGVQSAYPLLKRRHFTR